MLPDGRRFTEGSHDLDASYARDRSLRLKSGCAHDDATYRSTLRIELLDHRYLAVRNAEA